MTRKPEIQYIGQFYVHGSEARKLELKQTARPKTRLPIAKLEQVEKVYVDPVALIAMAVAMLLMVTMILGMVQLKEDWEEYRMMSRYVHELKESHHVKTMQFREVFDLEDVRMKATAMGMVPKSEAETRIVQVTHPERQVQMTMMDEIRWFIEGLFA